MLTFFSFLDKMLSSSKTLFGIDFHTLNFNSTPQQYDLDYLYKVQLGADAGKALGCAEWMKRNGSVGTHYANHGFDLVIGSSGEPNNLDWGGVSGFELALLLSGFFDLILLTRRKRE